MEGQEVEFHSLRMKELSRTAPSELTTQQCRERLVEEAFSSQR